MGITLPVWQERIRSRNRRSEPIRRPAGIELYNAERNLIFGRVRRVVATADSLSEQYRILHDQMIPRTKETLEINLADYRGKRSDFFSVVETYRDLLAFELHQLRIAANLAGTIVQIERQIGCPMANPAR
ncbi:MAG: hypothetical protein KatS3mg111_0956 [Pirellulaceae bacterium]|nr:MAG: hypothetical protein KatS3mg111_0956 [Pirellulaceae bacterium]